MTRLTLEQVDRDFYARHIRDLLPDRIVDCHTHVWTEDHLLPADAAAPSRSAAWAARVARTNPVPDLMDAYAQLFPAKDVTPVLMPAIETDIDGEGNNAYVARMSRELGAPALALTKPTMSADEFERTIRDGGFRGCKPYLNFAPSYLPSAEIRIYDFLPREHLDRANRNGWTVMLHIPRPGRLGDEVNLAQLQEIDRDFPDARVIVTHIGRAYDQSQVGRGMEVLGRSRNLLFDITANTNAAVMRRLLDAVGPHRVMFGSDSPIFFLRAHRITEGGSYVNVVPRGHYGDVSDDPTMRETDDASSITLLLYEEIAAFFDAARSVGLSASEREAVFSTTASRLFGISE